MAAVEELSVWDAPPSTSDENSQAAAASMIASAGTLRRVVLSCIGNNRGIAEWDLERRLSLPGNTVRPRVWELLKAGVIRRLDEKGVTPSGRACYLYVITDEGRRML